MGFWNMPIYDTIRETRGVSFSAVAKEMGMSRYQLTKHLEGLLIGYEKEEIYNAIERVKKKEETR